MFLNVLWLVNVLLFIGGYGGVLASPVNKPLYSKLKKIASEEFSNGLFTGIHATFSHGDYFSVEGIPIDKMSLDWLPGEPDNYQNMEECIILKSNGAAADINCSKVFPYVCYKAGAPSPNSNPYYCGNVDSGYNLDQRTGNCYKFHTEGRPWTRAFMSCAAEGAHLAIVNSELEAEVLKEIFAKQNVSEITSDIKHVASVGFHNWGEFRVWTTIHGQSLREAGYFKFEPGQPDNSQQGMYCGAMFNTGLLDDFACHLNAPYICEKPQDMQIPSVSLYPLV